MRLLRWLWNRPPWSKIFTGVWRLSVLATLGYLAYWQVIIKVAIVSMYKGMDYFAEILRNLGQIG